MAITCCNGCVPPKRNPYCHANCNEYKEQKEKHEQERAILEQKKKVESGLTSQAIKGVIRAKMASKRIKEKYYG